MINNEFLNIYEKLAILNEAKQDTLNFKNFFMKNGYSDSDSDDIVSRFNKIKLKLKGPERDYYYWMKRNPQEVFNKILSTEQAAEATKATKEKIADGAELVKETKYWKIYHITNFEAAQEYGRDSQWCITGINNYGRNYWDSYTKRGYTFYFLITKQNYDPRGNESKFAFAIHPQYEVYQVFNQQDKQCDLYDIPHFEEIEIPGIDLTNYTTDELYTCEKCGATISEDEVCPGEDGNIYCDDCWNELHFRCTECGEIFSTDDALRGTHNELYCSNCWLDNFFECESCGEIYNMSDLKISENDEYLCSDCYQDLYGEGE